jgi:hypothetical protein
LPEITLRFRDEKQGLVEPEILKFPTQKTKILKREKNMDQSCKSFHKMLIECSTLSEENFNEFEDFLLSEYFEYNIAYLNTRSLHRWLSQNFLFVMQMLLRYTYLFSYYQPSSSLASVFQHPLH